MKKLKLLIAFCALLLGWSNASAQKDVTSTYITNATLSQGMSTGWTVTYTGSGNYSHFNTVAQGNNTVGYATEAYAGWNELAYTAYSMTQTITLPAGNYRLVNYSFFRQGQNADTDASKSLAYLKAGEEKVAIKTLGSITAAGYANSQAEGANCFDSKMYRNVVEFTSDGTTPIEIGVYGTFDVAYSWCIVGMFELFDLDDAASVSSPTDVTYAITNPGFEYRDLTGWSREKDPSDAEDRGSFWYMNNEALSGKAGLGWVESYKGGGIPDGRSIYQDLTGLDNGLYEVTVYGHLQQGSGSDGFYLYANSDKVAIGNTDKDYSVRTTVTDGNLKIKLGTESCNGNWAAFDKVRLQFYGDPLEAYKDLLADKVAAAQTLHDGGTLPTAAASALQTVVDANDNDDDAFTTEEQFNTAISNIEAGMSSAEAFVAPYASFNALKAKATALQAVENTDAEANSTLATAISDQTTAADAATTADGIATATSTLKTAMITYVGAANPTSGNRFDLTFMVTNPDLTSFYNGSHGVKPEGWTSEEEDGNYQVIPSEGAANPDGIHKYCYEYWSNPAKASGKFALYNAVTLPEGTFTMNCYAFAVDQFTGSTVDGVFFYANNTQGSCVTSTTLSPQSISFINDAEQEVKIGLKTLTGNTRNWMGIGYVELYKVPAKVYEIRENANWDYSQSGAGDVTLTRTIVDNYNTVVFPFSMTQAEVEDKFGEDSKVYVVSAFANDNITFAVQEGIQANKPCLLKATKAGTSYNLEGRTIVSAASAAPTFGVTGISMVGNYNASFTVPQDEHSYIVSSDALYLVNSPVTVKNTRAYFVTDGGNNARSIRMSFDGVTGIATVENGAVKAVETGDIYDLSGRKVKKPSKGIYLMNGKKFVF